MMQRKQAAELETAELGVVTIGGDPAAVETRGEVRSLPVLGPGGYLWVPDRGEQVLVVKGGPGGEEQCLAGRVQNGADLLPGEVMLCCGGGSIRLSREGEIFLTGKLYVNGKPYLEPAVV